MRNFLKRLELFHNKLSDSSAVWFPFLFLKPLPNQRIGCLRLVLMTVCFSAFCTVLFVLRSLFFEREINLRDVLEVAFYFHIGFGLWFNFVTKVLWNKRASQLLSLAAFTLLILILNSSKVFSKTSTECFEGVAESFNGEPAYIERHKVISVNGKVSESLTRYYSPDRKNQIAELKSDYSNLTVLPNYQFRIFPSNYSDEVKVIPSKNKIFIRKKVGETPSSEKIIDQKKEHVAGQGFHQLIRENLDDIARGQVLHIRLIFPSQLDEYEFRIRLLRKDGNLLSLRLEIDSWILRIFAPSIEAEYEISTRQLLRYRGASNIQDKKGKNQNVEITYKYDSSVCP